MANWYEHRILPHIIRLGCGCQLLSGLREPVVGQASGRVLELGFGAGANLPFYDPEMLSELVGVEPSEELRAMTAANPHAARLGVRLIDAVGENLPFGDASFDTVVCTFTLCTVTDVRRTLAEARRVLRPGGAFLFCEHGRADDAGVAKWQRRVEPIWKRMCGGCHLTRHISGVIAEHFAIETCERGFLDKGLRIAGWMERGRAVAS